MKRVRSEWQGAILVCRKCTRKLDGGFGEDGTQSLAKLLKRSFGLHRKRKSRLGVAEVGCLDICPKRAVVAIDTRRPHQWQIIEAGLSPSEIAERLDLSPVRSDRVTDQGRD